MKQLNYPILLVHGMGFRDRKHINYWGRIPRTLEEEGTVVCYGLQDSNGSVEGNAAALANRIDKLTEEYGVEKFNVIAHSKGGLDIRYVISTLNRSSRIASLTTINTPHNGSYTVDRLLKCPSFLVKAGCWFVDGWFRILGDKRPETYKAIKLFETKSAVEFNRNNPDDPGVYYQSYAFTCKTVTGDIFLWLSNLIVRLIEGENDGFLTTEAVSWTNFRGTYRSTTNRGISPCDEVDMMRKPFTRKPPSSEYEISDITDFYRNVVSELKEKGF